MSTEKVVTIITPELIEEETSAEYNEEELQKLVIYFKEMTTLYDLRDEDWTEENERTIREFFIDITMPMLLIYFINDDLQVTDNFPDEPVIDLAYFIREPKEIFDVESFHDSVTFGSAHDNVEGTILNVMENVYAPIFVNITTWPDSILYYSF